MYFLIAVAKSTHVNWTTVLEAVSSLAGLAGLCGGIMAWIFRRWKKQQEAQQIAEKKLVTEIVGELVGPEVGKEVSALLKTDIREAIKNQVKEDFASSLGIITDTVTQLSNSIEWITSELKPNGGGSIKDAIDRNGAALVGLRTDMSLVKEGMGELKESQAAVRATLLERKDGEGRLDDRVDQLQNIVIRHIGEK